MTHYNIPHNTCEWFEMRAGLATSSCFGKIITPSGGDSKSADEYADTIIAELILNKPIERDLKLYSLEWGNMHEDNARNLYEFETGFEVKEGGFYIDESRTFGSSPDARVFKGGELNRLAEIKCPENPAIHMKFLFSGKINNLYKPQVYSQMCISGVGCHDWFSYYPGLPSNRITTYADDDGEYMQRMEDKMEKFRETVKSKIKQLREMGYEKEIPVKSLERFNKKYKQAHEQPKQEA